MEDNLVYIDNYGLLGSNFYWQKGIEIGIPKKILAKAGLTDKRVKVHKNIIKPLKKVNEDLRKRGYRLYITEGYRSKELYELINKEISKRIGKGNKDRILNMKDMFHTSGKAVDVALWKDGKKVILHEKKDGINGYFFGFYKNTNNHYHELQEMLIGIMQRNGFRLGEKGEYFHFNYDLK